MTMTTHNSCHPQHTQSQSKHMWTDASKCNPPNKSPSTPATSFLFTKSTSSLYLLYLDIPLFLHHFSICMYLSTLCPLHLYYLCLDFWSLDPLIPNPTLLNTYSSVVLLSYCMWSTCLSGHCLTLLSSYITCRYFACSPQFAYQIRYSLSHLSACLWNLTAWLVQGTQDCIQGQCHNHDIPPQASHTYSCLLAVQTPPKQSLTKPEPIPGLPDPSTAFPNPSAAFLKGCCTNVCLVSIPEAVNTIPKHIWPFLMNPKHLESHRPTPSLHAHLWTWRLSICNHDRVKPEHLALFPIESYSSSLILFIIHPFLPLSCSLLSFLFLHQPCICLVSYHTLLYHYTPCPYLMTTPRPFLPGPHL